MRGKVLLVVSTDWDECLLEPVALALELAQKSASDSLCFPVIFGDTGSQGQAYLLVM